MLCSCLQLFALVCAGYSGITLQLLMFTMRLNCTVAYTQVYAPLRSCMVNSLQVDLRDCTSLYELRCSYNFIVPNYGSALRVVIPTRLTIVTFMLCICVYKGNETTKDPFLKFVLKCRNSVRLSKAKTALKYHKLDVSFHLVLGAFASFCCYSKFFLLRFTR